MADVFLPNSSKAVPKTNDERTIAAEPPKVSRTIVAEDPPDPPGEEMAKEARVWKTYVREADRWDKEMIDGRNSSLDVMLIFAALFSAISTAFIIESLGGLRPDPADSSAQTLLLMSQTLTAIANGQPAPSPPADTFNPRPFSPPRSAVVVNVLWLLSLSLSVAVSLVAMLAKDWCHKFMSGRSGPMYEQARKRQEKWNGMERWKMAELLVYLPIAMHLALLLFAAGLCVYLWDINVGVAVPVVVITGLATVVYAFATVLPFFDRFCPYNTPIATAFASLVNLAKKLHRMAHSAAYRQYLQTSEPKWLESVFERIAAWLDPGDASRDITPNPVEESRTPMDLTTSQMIAWLIANCEDSRSVDIALQAITGHADLPHTALAQSGAIHIAASRLQAFAQSSSLASEKLSVDELPRLLNALQYGRTCVILLFGDSYKASENRWELYSNPFDGRIYYRNSHIVYSLYINLWELTLKQDIQSDIPAIQAAAAAMPFCHWAAASYYDLDLIKLGTIAGTLASTLEEQLQGSKTILPTFILNIIVESLAHYLIGLWPREGNYGRNNLIPILLSRIFITSYNTAPNTARATAVTLAASAFASYTYKGGEMPTPDVDAREKRAVNVLHYYQGKELGNEEVMSLFMFGFFSWLPQIISSGSFAQLADFNRDLSSIMNDAWQTPHLSGTASGTWSLPDSFSLLEHAIRPVSAYLAPAIDETSDKTALVSACLLPWVRNNSHIGAYMIALISLCGTESKEDQKLCMQVIARQHIPDKPLQELNSIDGKHLLEQLCHTLLTTDAMVIPFVAVHFGMLVASIVSDSGLLEDRKSTLCPLLSLRDHCPGLREPKLFTLSDMFSYLEENLENGPTDDTLLQVMQYVVDFCDDSLDSAQPAGLDSGDQRYSPHRLKRWYQSSPEELEMLLAKTQRDAVLLAQQKTAEALPNASETHQDA
ncbi:hypothetical protein FRC12_003502 [Ceratobasidium sp. 428]|nr:hypothetical protein FRC12_003502 [Ceratobasidium sp. 428]